MARTWHHLPQTKRNDTRRHERRTTRQSVRQNLAMYVGRTNVEADDRA
jgi:hypothetical protein